MHSLSIRQGKLQRITKQLWQRTILMQASSSTIPPTRLYSSSILSTAISRYEDFIGLTEVKKAQDAVIAAENKFANCQEQRRAKQIELKQVQMRLRDIHTDLDRTSRGEDKYLHLLTDEHKQIKIERSLIDQFQMLENEERDTFHRLSSCLRDSHEKERQRSERTKYWSIVGSLIGAVVGIVGATIGNRMRMRDLQSIVDSTSDPGRLQALLAELTQLVHSQQQHVTSFIGDIKSMIDPQSNYITTSVDTNSQHTEEILSAIRDQDVRISKDLDDLKRLIAVQYGKSYDVDGSPSIVYVGPDMQQLLGETERNIEWKMKLQTVLNVVLVYTALAITVPLVIAIFRGGGG